MQQNSTKTPIISNEEIEQLVGSKHSHFFQNLNPLTLLLLEDEASEENIKESLTKALKNMSGDLPDNEEVEALYQSLKKIAAYIEQKKLFE